MADRHTTPSSTVIPTLRYRDAQAAIEWLCRVLGFSIHLVVPGEKEGAVEHAQLTLGSGMIMIGSARDDAYGALVQPPGTPGAAVTQSAYIIVDEIDAHYAHARAEGAEIVIDLEAQDYGGKLYSCRDPEGQLWSIGSYDPWTGEG